MTIAFYGIPNCDTVKKARKWLEAQGLDYTFHDYKKEGADPAKLERWVAAAGWEKVLNRAGTTFRKLPEDDKVDLDAAKAVKIMEASPSTIKRPVVEYPGGILVGFKEADWTAALK
ncbi:arsenate reductase [Novosphingobium mangrovi (ex Huang et al. 2023)]|uniref:Arsenate reductase n=1 Tax=Novosphingobium mangrovi (ex Huang et al. 2023) TaxID=2976432 RepID=A0ABT2I8I9_9SPHN|nr:arsenate reductase [Novosphingobium mangrovi (ex Huang et al. 2023)]MCT2401135.1 arsenate reductase [Novosphingobium mangrovi (ex Huang et al. 2023)]